MTDTCVLCGSEKYRVISSKLRHDKPGTVVTCTECGLSRLLGARGYATRINDYYTEQYALEYHQGVKKELDSLTDSFLPVQAHRVEKIKPFLKKDHRVLEIGSSTGYFLESVKPFVGEVQGLELNSSEARYATEVRKVPTIDVPHEKSSLPEHYFDHVCLFQVLEHAADPIAFLQSLRRFLRPEGKIHMEIPNLMDPLVFFYDVEDYRNFFYQEPHLYYFTPETLQRTCEAAEYRTISIFPFQQTSLINNLNWLFLHKGQRSRWDCIQAALPEGFIRGDVPREMKGEFDGLLKAFNIEYIKFMERVGFTDMVFATISI